MKEKLLIVFVKNAHLGKVKTRLAKDLGDEKALAVYLKLLSHTFQITEQFNGDVAIYYSEYVDSEDHWSKGGYKKFVQKGENLGQRMHHAIAAGLAAGYEQVCLIGSDIYELSTEVLDDAFAQLNKADLVIGPAKDGGYYLIGMKSANRDIFKLEKWSTPDVFKQTCLLLERNGLSYTCTTQLNDIDTLSDLKSTDLFDKLFQEPKSDI